MRRNTRVASLVAASIVTIGAVSSARAEPQYPYPYPYPPPLVYPQVFVRGGDLRFLVEPKQTLVFIDGYFIGIADNFAGLFQHLQVPPGDREITLYLDGYRTVSQKVSVTSGATYKLHYTMEKLAPGMKNQPPPSPPAATPPAGRAVAPRAQRPPPPMPPSPPASTSNFGTLVIQVQPAGAEILIDGERWHGPEGEERLLVQVEDGSHRVEIVKDGYRRFSTELLIHRGETVPLNVNLSPDKQ